MRRALASGVLGPVLAVEDGRGGDLLALKLIQTSAPTDAEALAAALQHLVAPSLEHPALLPVLAVGADPLGAYVVMPLLEVPTLDARLRGGRQTVALVLEWLGPVATGLQHAHTSGVLHGALHPRDVLLARPHAVLSGVGVIPALEACDLEAPVRIPFTAPERAAGDEWDEAADQYSLAMLALDALSGRRLVAGTIPAFDRWPLADTPAEDARLHEVFARALHPDPDRRFGSIAGWLDALAGAAGATSELSRFTRDGVIPASAAARAAQVVSIDAVPEPLDLFAPENATEVDTADDAKPPADATRRGQVRDQEWLVAAFPDDPPFDPAPAFDGARSEDTIYAPIEDTADGEADHDEGIDVRDAAVVLAADGAGESVYATPDRLLDQDAADGDDLPLSAEAAGAAFAPDPRHEPTRRRAEEPASARRVESDGEGDDESAGSWGIDEPVEDEGGSRPLIILTIVALAVLAVGYGTWRSMSGGTSGARAPIATSADRMAPEPPPEPTAVTEEAIVPSQEELEPGVAIDVGRDGSVVAPGSRVAGPPAVVQAPPPPAPATPAASAVPGSAATGSGASPAGGGELPADAEGRGRVLIRASPAGAVRVNGRDYGTTPVVLRDLPFGSYVVSIARPGFETVVREVDLLASRPVASITVDLERVGASSSATATTQPPVPPARSPESPTPGVPGADAAARAGGLLVVSRPTGARVRIDGRDYGTTPVAVPGLAEGRHVIRLDLAGYRTWEGPGDVQAGQRVRVEANLVQGPR